MRINNLLLCSFYHLPIVQERLRDTHNTANPIYQYTSTTTMDGDASGKTMDKGASSALHEQELTGGIHEDSKPRQVFLHLQ